MSLCRCARLKQGAWCFRLSIYQRKVSTFNMIETFADFQFLVVCTRLYFVGPSDDRSVRRLTDWLCIRVGVQWKNHVFFLAAQGLHPIDVWSLHTKFQVICVTGNRHRHTPPFPRLLFEADFPFFISFNFWLLVYHWPFLFSFSYEACV